VHSGLKRIDGNFIQRVHRVLIRKKWGIQLPYEGFAFFVEVLLQFPPAAADDMNTLTAHVKAALKLVNVHNAHISWTTSNAVGTRTDPTAAVIPAVLDVIRQVNRDIDESGRALVAQHGAVLQHASIDDLMNKLGKAVDVATVQCLHEQLGAIHAAQFVSRHRIAAEKLRRLEDLLAEINQSIKAQEA